MRDLRFGVIGEFNGANPTHIATDDALRHAGHSLQVGVEIEWLPTDRRQDLAAYDAFVCAPGSPHFLELTDHPIYVATLFVPQTRSTVDRPTALFTRLIQSAKTSRDPSCRPS